MAVIRRGRKWWISVKWRGREYRRSTNCRTKREARHEMQRWHDEITSGRAARDMKMLFVEFGDRYLEEYAKPNKRSWKRDRSSLVPLVKFFGDYRLTDITPALVMSYRSRRSQQVSNSTTNRELSILRKMLNLAVLWDFLSRSPISRVRPLLLPEDNLRDRVLLPEEETKLLNIPTAAPHLKDIIQFLLYTGMRPNEALRLEWSDVNFNFNRIKIDAINAKSKKSRYLPMNDVVRNILARRQGKAHGDRVFPISYSSFNKSFTTLRRRAGIDGISPYTLRHTFGSRLTMNGVPLPTIKKLMGHATIRMTERYMHPTDEKEAIEGLISRTKAERVTKGVTIG